MDLCGQSLVNVLAVKCTRAKWYQTFLSAVRQGEIGYYLPDEDYGSELSVYSDFCHVRKLLCQD